MAMEEPKAPLRKRDSTASGVSVSSPVRKARLLERESSVRSVDPRMDCLPPISPPPPDEFDELFKLGAIPPPSPASAAFRPAVEKGTKYVVVSGGVCSSLGKGVATSSIGALLRGHGFRVTAIKMDPYINIDAGLMSPYEHGEVYVLDDGGETDLDLGNYERMMFLSLGRNNNITTGKIYDHVIQKERRGEYLGKTVQVVPHITGAIVEWLNKTAQAPVDSSSQRPHVCMIELGGTIGDIESMPFVEALRALKFSLPENSLAWCHCSYVPNMSGQKTKPTQHSVKALLALGIQPDIIICRSSEELVDDTRKKIANQCNIAARRILSCYDVNNLFHVPGVLAEQHVVGSNTRSTPALLCFRTTCSELPVSIFYKATMQGHGAKTSKGLNCVLPNPRSIMIICLAFCSHLMYHMSNVNPGSQSVAEIGADAACVKRFGSVFPFCLPDAEEDLEQLLEVSPKVVAEPVR